MDLSDHSLRSVTLKCERCGYTHAGTDKFHFRTPRRCPVCGSTRLVSSVVSSSTQLDEVTRTQSETLSDMNQVYLLLGAVKNLDLQQQKHSRNRLKELGIYVLKLEDERSSLKEVLSKAEARWYLQLVQEGNYGLASIADSIIAVSPNSPIRPHVGVSQVLLRELRDCATSS